LNDVEQTKPGLLERLEQGPVICAEGYLFELERRGYLQAGAFVPEVVLEHPEHRLPGERIHAPSDPVGERLGIAIDEAVLTQHFQRSRDLALLAADERRDSRDGEALAVRGLEGHQNRKTPPQACCCLSNQGCQDYDESRSIATSILAITVVV